MADELEAVHAPGYVERVASTKGREFVSLDPDTSTSAGSYEAALLAAGGLCKAIDAVVSGAIENAFALVRPPGHHAEHSRAMGFCLFNNIAVGARFAQSMHGANRVLIVDWDLHHGNGTQHMFEDDASVLYFSTHQHPYYPGTGSADEVGRGAGEGFTVNVPLPTGHGDCEYVAIFEKILRPIAREYDPDLILVSAGFDIYESDPLGGMNVSPEGFAALTRSLMNMAEECCGGKVILALEGGYHLGGLRDSVKAVLREMASMSSANLEDFLSRVDTARFQSVSTMVSRAHGAFWKGL